MDLESELAIILAPLDPVIIRSEGLVDVVGVGRILGALGVVRLLVAGLDHFAADDLVAFDHLDGEDVVDLDVVSRDTVVQELGREHHVVTGVPEFGVVLSVESHNVTGADESEARHDQERAEAVHEEG